MSSLGLTISKRSNGTFTTAASNLPGVVTAIGPYEFELGKRRRSLSNVIGSHFYAALW